MADPCSRGGPIEPHLLALGRRYGFEMDWYPGFRLALDAVPEQFRGFAVKPLAQRIARGEYIDAAALGAAENDYRLHPDAWTGWGDQNETDQGHKKVNVVMHFSPGIRQVHFLQCNPKIF